MLMLPAEYVPVVVVRKLDRITDAFGEVSEFHSGATILAICPEENRHPAGNCSVRPVSPPISQSVTVSRPMVEQLPS